jgi:hypothetical protein
MHSTPECCIATSDDVVVSLDHDVQAEYQQLSMQETADKSM